VEAQEPLERAITILIEDLDWPVDPTTVGPKTVVGGDGLGLDSIGVLGLIVALEDHYGVALDLGKLGDLASLTMGEIVAEIRTLSATDNRLK